MQLTGTDCYLLALDGMMFRSGQNRLKGQVHILLDKTPDMALITQAAAKLAASHPLLDARISRNPLTWIASWSTTKSLGNLPIHLWREEGVDEKLLPAARTTPSLECWTEDVLNSSSGEEDGCRNLRIDIVQLCKGGAALVLTWNHLLFDGKGAELIARELLRGAEPRFIQNNPVSQPSLLERLKQAKPVTDHLMEISSQGFSSLSGPRPIASRMKYRRIGLDRETSKMVFERASRLASPLAHASFYLASTARAHQRVLLSRGCDPGRFVASIPVQMRRRGGDARIFQNHVTVLFFCFEKGDLSSLEAATASAQSQFEEMTRNRLDRAMHRVMEFMKWLPSRFYMRFLRSQFGGELTSFFHSFTGEFAFGQETFGANVEDFYHIPCVSTPPGSGLFMGVFDQRLSITHSWRESALTEAEADMLMAAFLTDLTGKSTS
jgi:hypothetical protein